MATTYRQSGCADYVIVNFPRGVYRSRHHQTTFKAPWDGVHFARLISEVFIHERVSAARRKPRLKFFGSYAAVCHPYSGRAPR
jgi:hypothetical protein